MCTTKSLVKLYNEILAYMTFVVAVRFYIVIGIIFLFLFHSHG